MKDSDCETVSETCEYTLQEDQEVAMLTMAPLEKWILQIAAEFKWCASVQAAYDWQHHVSHAAVVKFDLKQPSEG